MKKITLLFIVFVSQINFAQNWLKPDGNVGIGTLDPQVKLDVFGQGRFKVPDDQSGIGGLTIETDNGTNLRLGGNSSYSWIQSHMSLPLYINELGNNTIFNIAGGLVGIGTISPAARLDVKSWDVAAFFRSTANSVPVSIINTGSSVSSIGFKGSTSLNEFNVRLGADGNDLVSYTNNVERTRIAASGNFGVGTNNPLAKLEVYNGNILVRNSSNIDNESSIIIAHSINHLAYDTFGVSLRTITESAGYNTYGMQFFTQDSFLTGQTEKLRIQGNGNVGIGITNPQNKLDVNGTIHSKEVKVDMLGWSDFVFKKEYNLPTLEEVEKHIVEKGHLENIPSEEEVLRNGIKLGEMNSKLLQKIEELTLYTIELKKENNIQSRKIEELEKENSSFKLLSDRISILENQQKK
ncbi:hypothetical protein ACWA1F_13320 [Flavobacterium sp. 3-218]